MKKQTFNFQTKILSTSQVTAYYESILHQELATPLILLEQAAQCCLEFFERKFPKNETIYLFCGNGKKGAVGLALARLLYFGGFYVKVFVDTSAHKMAPENQSNRTLLKEIKINLNDFSDFKTEEITQKTIIVDAFLGMGLTRCIEGVWAKMISKINTISCLKIALDIPSGLFFDQVPPESFLIFEADYTLSFQWYKKSFLHPEAGRYCGTIEILDLGFGAEVPAQKNLLQDVFLEKQAQSIYSSKIDSYKVSKKSKACIIAGACYRMGPAVLASHAALRTGVENTYVLTSEIGSEVLQNILPEAIPLIAGKTHLKKSIVIENATYGIGSGIGFHPETERLILNFIMDTSTPVVLASDALHILSRHKNYVFHLPSKSVIIAEYKEIEWLLGKAANSFEQLERAMKKAKELEVYFVLKGYSTQVITPENNIYYHLINPSVQHKNGMGELLFGILTSFLAQGYPPQDALLLGVWFYGKALQYCIEKNTIEYILATDVLAEFPNVFLDLTKKEKC